MGRIITSSDINYSNNDRNNRNSKIEIVIIMVSENLRVANNGFIISLDAPMHFRHSPHEKMPLNLCIETIPEKKCVSQDFQNM